jgi:hypothetical protein
MAFRASIVGEVEPRANCVDGDGVAGRVGCCRFETFGAKISNRTRSEAEKRAVAVSAGTVATKHERVASSTASHPSFPNRLRHGTNLFSSLESTVIGLPPRCCKLRMQNSSSLAPALSACVPQSAPTFCGRRGLHVLVRVVECTAHRRAEHVRIAQ